jgi:hypothetical protein
MNVFCNVACRWLKRSMALTLYRSLNRYGASLLALARAPHGIRTQQIHYGALPTLLMDILLLLLLLLLAPVL